MSSDIDFPAPLSVRQQTLQLYRIGAFCETSMTCPCVGCIIACYIEISENIFPGLTRHSGPERDVNCLMRFITKKDKGMLIGHIHQRIARDESTALLTEKVQRQL